MKYDFKVNFGIFRDKIGKKVNFYKINVFSI